MKESTKEVLVGIGYAFLFFVCSFYLVCISWVLGS